MSFAVQKFSQVDNSLRGSAGVLLSSSSSPLIISEQEQGPLSGLHAAFKMCLRQCP